MSSDILLKSPNPIYPLFLPITIASKPPPMPKEQITGYTGGALNQLADYGRSRVDAGGIPEFNVDGTVSSFGRGSRQNQYDPNFDINRDPGVQFRQQEQERAINRNMAGMGKFQSGNRMEELLKRSGELASQEYGQAYGRNVQDFGLRSGVNTENYGRDTGEYQLRRGEEDARYGRGTTQYNADAAREAALYGRQYGQEGDYLNRLAALSNIGQSATNATTAAGTANAANVGNLTMQGANTQAAAQLGQGAAWQNAIGQGAQLYGMYGGGNPLPSYNMNVPTGGTLTSTSGGYGGTGMGVWYS